MMYACIYNLIICYIHTHMCAYMCKMKHVALPFLPRAGRSEWKQPKLNCYISDCNWASWISTYRNFLFIQGISTDLKAVVWHCHSSTNWNLHIKTRGFKSWLPSRSTWVIVTRASRRRGSIIQHAGSARQTGGLRCGNILGIFRRSK